MAMVLRVCLPSFLSLVTLTQAHQEGGRAVATIAKVRGFILEVSETTNPL